MLRLRLKLLITLVNCLIIIILILVIAANINEGKILNHYYNGLDKSVDMCLFSLRNWGDFEC